MANARRELLSNIEDALNEDFDEARFAGYSYDEWKDVALDSPSSRVGELLDEIPRDGFYDDTMSEVEDFL